MENSKLKLISSTLSSTLVTFSVIYTTYKFLFWVEEKYYNRKFHKLVNDIREMEDKSIELENKSNDTIENSK